MQRRTRLAALVSGLAATSLLVAPGTSSALTVARPHFYPPSRADDPKISASDAKYVNEPATVVGSDGARYVANQRKSQLNVTRDGGRSWSHPGGAQVLTKNVSGCSSARDVGDVDLAADSAGRVYFADLQVTAGGTGDNGIQPVVARSDDGFRTYSGTCAAHQPASVDREWMAAYSAPGAPANQSDVYLSYHDFGPNYISVNASHDGGRTWGLPVPVITNGDAALSSACDTVPAGTAVDPRNGWVYVAWTSGPNPANNAATGCNYTQGTVFNKFFVAVSKDKGATFTTTRAFVGPDTTSARTPSDMSEIFGSIAVDRQGGVYIAFPAYLLGEYDVFYAYSPPADRANMLGFTPPRKVNGTATKTAYFPRLVAGDKGRIDMIYLGTPVRNVAVTPETKAQYDGSDPSKPNCQPELSDPGNKGVRFPGKPCELPADAPWYLYLAQSLNATSFSPTFTTQKLRSDPVHTGDICTLGIFCLDGDNRDIADVNDVKIDRTGGAQVAYTYETPNGARTEIDFQCQSGGPGLYAGTTVRDCRSTS